MDDQQEGFGHGRVPAVPHARWKLRVRVAQGDAVHLTARFADEVLPRTVLATVEPALKGEAVGVSRGLSWSQALGAPFVYVATADRLWASSAISFESAVDEVTVQFWGWPRRRPLLASEVERLALTRNSGDTATAVFGGLLG